MIHTNEIKLVDPEVISEFKKIAKVLGKRYEQALQEQIKRQEQVK